MLNLPHVQTQLSSAFFWFINITLIVELIGKIEAFDLCLLKKHIGKKVHIEQSFQRRHFLASLWYSLMLTLHLILLAHFLKSLPLRVREFVQLTKRLKTTNIANEGRAVAVIGVTMVPSCGHVPSVRLTKG